MTTQQTASAVPAVFQGNGEIRFQEVNGEFCLTAEQVAHGLGLSDISSIHNIYKNHEDELAPFRFMDDSSINSKEGRPAYLFTEEGVYLISMWARTPAAKAFRLKVAGLLKSLRQRKMEAIRTETALAVIDLQHSLGGRDMDFVWRLIRYRRKDLYQWEVGKLLGVSKDTVSRMEKRLRKAGLWEVL